MLRAHDLPATIFVTTDPVSTGQKLWWDDLQRIVADAPVDHLTVSSGGCRLKVRLGERSADDGRWHPGRPPSNARQAAFLELWTALRSQQAASRDEAIEELRAQTDTPLRSRESHRPMTPDELRTLLGTATRSAHTGWSAIPSSPSGRRPTSGLRSTEDAGPAHFSPEGCRRVFAYPYGDHDPVADRAFPQGRVRGGLHDGDRAGSSRLRRARTPTVCRWRTGRLSNSNERSAFHESNGARCRRRQRCGGDLQPRAVCEAVAAQRGGAGDGTLIRDRRRWFFDRRHPSDCHRLRRSRAPRTRLLLSSRNLRSNEVVAHRHPECERSLPVRARWRRLLDVTHQARPTGGLARRGSHSVGVLPQHDGGPGGRATRRSLDSGEPSHPYGRGRDLDGQSVRHLCWDVAPDALRSLGAWYDDFFPITDWPLYILCTEHGDIAFDDEPVGVYRLHDGSEFSSLPTRTKFEMMSSFYERMDAALSHRSHDRAKAGASRYFFDWARVSPPGQGDRAMGRLCLRLCLRSGGVGSSVGRTENSGGVRGNSVEGNLAACRDPAGRLRCSTPDVVGDDSDVRLCRNTLGETLRSVLDQELGPNEMQIEVVDDSSDRDDPEAIVCDVGGGTGPVLPTAGECRACQELRDVLAAFRGHYVHLLHGDDFVLPGFYDALRSGFESNPSVGAAFCRWMIVDEANHVQAIAEPRQDHAGELVDAAIHLASEQHIVTPSIAVRRDVYELLGGFDERLQCAEDWEMWVRIAANFEVWYEPYVAAVYRSHPDSNTGRHHRLAEELRYTAMVIDMIESYLPPDRAAAVARIARQNYREDGSGQRAAVHLCR